MSDINAGPAAKPTLDSLQTAVTTLQATVAALQLRIAYLETRTGFPTNDTLVDLPADEALSLVGGDATRLEQAVADVQERQQLRIVVPTAPVTPVRINVPTQQGVTNGDSASTPDLGEQPAGNDGGAAQQQPGPLLG